MNSELVALTDSGKQNLYAEFSKVNQSVNHAPVSQDYGVLAGKNTVAKSSSDISALSELDSVVPHQTAEELRKEEDETKEKADDGSMTPFLK